MTSQTSNTNNPHSFNPHSTQNLILLFIFLIFIIILFFPFYNFSVFIIIIIKQIFVGDNWVSGVRRCLMKLAKPVAVRSIALMPNLELFALECWHAGAQSKDKQRTEIFFSKFI